MSSLVLTGNRILGFHVRIWAGVKELMSSPTYTSGLEFITASASFRIVRSCSEVRHILPIALRRDLLTIPTSLS